MSIPAVGRTTLLAMVAATLASGCAHEASGAVSQPVTSPDAPARGGAVVAAISRIRGQNHQELPAAQAMSELGGGPSRITVQNSTSFTLTVYLAGPMTVGFSIPQFASRTIDFPPGSYEMACELASQGALPMYGHLTAAAGMRYTETLYAH